MKWVQASRAVCRSLKSSIKHSEQRNYVYAYISAPLCRDCNASHLDMHCIGFSVTSMEWMALRQSLSRWPPYDLIHFHLFNVTAV